MGDLADCPKQGLPHRATVTPVPRETAAPAGLLPLARPSLSLERTQGAACLCARAPFPRLMAQPGRASGTGRLPAPASGLGPTGAALKNKLKADFRPSILVIYFTRQNVKNDQVSVSLCVSEQAPPPSRRSCPTAAPGAGGPHTQPLRHAVLSRHPGTSPGRYTLEQSAHAVPKPSCQGKQARTRKAGHQVFTQPASCHTCFQITNVAGGPDHRAPLALPFQTSSGHRAESPQSQSVIMQGQTAQGGCSGNSNIRPSQQEDSGTTDNTPLGGALPAALAVSPQQNRAPAPWAPAGELPHQLPSPSIAHQGRVPQSPCPAHPEWPQPRPTPGGTLTCALREEQTQDAALPASGSAVGTRPGPGAGALTARGPRHHHTRHPPPRVGPAPTDAHDTVPRGRSSFRPAHTRGRLSRNPCAFFPAAQSPLLSWGLWHGDTHRSALTPGHQPSPGWQSP